MGDGITSLPHNVVEEDEITDPTFLTHHALQERTKRQTQILQYFQQQWKSEYLTSLRDTHKGTHTSKKTIKIADIVIVHDDILRFRWKLAIIEELIEGVDGYTRAAKIRTANGPTNRPVAKLFPLEVSAAYEMETNATKEDTNVDHKDNDDQDGPPAVCEQLTRNAAIRAHDRIAIYYPWPQRMSLILTKNLLISYVKHVLGLGYFSFIIVLWYCVWVT